MELVYVHLRQGGEREAERVEQLCRRVGIVWVVVDRDILLRAARVKARHHLSLADAIVAATALKLGTALVHRDPEFEALAGEVPLVSLPPLA
jgi:predicted nucleic acid-binding protein